ncbi:response regulator [Catenulispora pinisilvae]|uniref:response regulator n=1 Tax=Catenulispora pinisilvae TaxID=2705253 RepID=UPI001890BA12
MPEAIRVLIAEDAVLLREGLARLLADSGFDVVAKVDDGKGMVDAADALKPDVIVADVRMPPSFTDEGLRAAVEVRAKHPDMAILVFSQAVEAAYAQELFSNSANGLGYLLKERVAEVEEFVDALKRVAAGGTALDPEVVAQLLGRRKRNDPLETLTPREREVLGLMAEGRSNSAIAAGLFVTEKAVEKHTSSIFTKLDLTPAAEDHRRVMAVLRYLNV